jgi:Sulfotransferase family
VTTASRPADPVQRFFFVHVQKTAGTTLWRRLKRQFAPEELYPGPSDGRPPTTTLVVEHLVERWNARRDEIRLVTGHFPLCTTELLDADFATLTLLRDPVERTLSALRHHREKTAADRELPLEQIYDDPLRFELVHNHMVKMFALTVDEMTDGALTHVDFTSEHLRRAKERLATIDVVGLQSRFEEFCAALTSRFDWKLGPPQFANRTVPLEVANAFRERIANDNELDMELYEYAQDLCAVRQS